ncbi:MAG: hypothetical protein HPY45_09510 [Anaerolineae bacterium]|nr:hypothetical protein [Anaerolineae bacterium]
MSKKFLRITLGAIVLAAAVLACGTKTSPQPTVAPPPSAELPKAEPTQLPPTPASTPTKEWIAPEGLEGWSEEDVQQMTDKLYNASDEELAEMLADMNEEEIAELDALLTYVNDQQLTDRVITIYQTLLKPSAGDEPWRMAPMEGAELLLSVKDGEVPPDWMDIVSYHAKAQALPPGYYVEIYFLPNGTKLKEVRTHYIAVAGEQGMKKARDEDFRAGDGLITWLSATAKTKKYSVYYNPGTEQPWCIVFYSNPDL